MPFNTTIAPQAQDSIDALANQYPVKHRKVLKALGLLQNNPRHPGLRTHEYISLNGPANEKVLVAYVENNTPAAYRIFWYYGPGTGEISVMAVTPHP